MKDPPKTLDEVRVIIREEVSKLDEKPYADSVISVNLKFVNDYFGEEEKNNLIDEFDLEKYGWRKDSKEIKRFGKFDFDPPLF